VQCLETLITMKERGGSSATSRQYIPTQSRTSPTRPKVIPKQKLNIILNSKLRLVVKLIKGLITNILHEPTNGIFIFVKTIFDLWLNSGYLRMISYMKTCRIHITQYICNNPKKFNDNRVSLDKQGFPTKFLYLKPIIDKRTRGGIRKVLTLLNLTRALDPLGFEDKRILPNFSTITDEYTGVKTGKILIPKWFMTEFVKKWNLASKTPVYTLENSHYISLKGGPGGKSSIKAMESLKSLNDQQLRWIKNITGEFFFNKILESKEKLTTDLPSTEYNGKLGIVKDPEGKRRIIAMVDYHSQMVLRPIHDILLNKLSNIPMDRTFTQNPWFNGPQKRSSNNYHSLDLSAATDRFPLFLQQRLLSTMFNNTKFARSWANLLTKRDFHYVVNGKTLKVCKYAVGQPMGCYSSWAAFTLSHHLIVAWSAYLAGYKHFDEYIILGDDIVIKNDKIASHYRHVMGQFGVSISEAKTHVSKDTYEFAKRWIYKGYDVSGLPLKGILKQLRSVQVVYLNIYEWFLRNPDIVIPDLEKAVAKTLVLLKQNKRRIKGVKWFKKKFQQLRIMLDYSQNLVDSNTLYEYIKVRQPDFDKLVLPEHRDNIRSFVKEMLSYALQSIVRETLQKVLSTLSKFKKNSELSDLDKLLHPHYWALKRSIRTAGEAVLEASKEESLLMDVMPKIQIVSYDSLVQKLRNKSGFIADLTKLWSRLNEIINIVKPFGPWPGVSDRPVLMNPFEPVIKAWDNYEELVKFNVKKPKEKGSGRVFYRDALKGTRWEKFYLKVYTAVKDYDKTRQRLINEKLKKRELLKQKKAKKKLKPKVVIKP